MLALTYPEASERRRLLQIKLAALPSHVSMERWVKEFAGASSADIERTCIDALRLTILEGASATEDRHIAISRSRLRSRREAVNAIALTEMH